MFLSLVRDCRRAGFKFRRRVDEDDTRISRLADKEDHGFARRTLKSCEKCRILVSPIDIVCIYCFFLFLPHFILKTESS